MLCKVFTIGESHKHLYRIRSLKITMSLSVAPLYLLFKDHKGWSLETGGPPPSRPVVSAGGGQNDHMSEIISHVLEPVAKTMTGGMEVESTGDMMALMNEINDENHEIEDIDLESIDKELEDQERLAEERYNNFDLPDGWKPETETSNLGDYKQSESTLPEGWKAGDTTASVTATCGNVSSAVVVNNDAENIDLQTSHTGSKSGVEGEIDNTLPEGWKDIQDKTGGEGGVNAPTGSKSNNVFKENTRTELDIKTGIDDGQEAVSKANTLHKTYQKSSNATKKTNQIKIKEKTIKQKITQIQKIK